MPGPPLPRFGGRGVRGEGGWLAGRSDSVSSPGALTPLTPTLSPRSGGRGSKSAAPLRDFPMTRSLFLSLVLAAPALADSPNVVIISPTTRATATSVLRRTRPSARRTSTGWRKGGTRLTSFYVAQPVCTASRAALMTGCYSNRVGLPGRSTTRAPSASTRTRRCSPSCSRAGATPPPAFGKWHLGTKPTFLPTRHGFDEFLGLPYSNDNGPLHPVRPRPPCPAAVRRREGH